MKSKLFCVAIILVLLLVGLVPAAIAAPPLDDTPEFVPKVDNRPDPLTTRQLELKNQALEARLNGKALGKIHEVSSGIFVELEREGEGAIWTVLGEFADIKHNEMPEPNREVDNTNIWVEDFSRDYYLDLLFNDNPGANSLRNFYIEQSSNRYTVHGDVTDWVTVSGDAATYDDDKNLPGGGNAVWYFLDESTDLWYYGQIDAGMTKAEIDAYLSQYDVWDRYDYDGDGNFNEPDGYIDTFQSVHAGVGNEACSGTCDWAIWSHSWYAFSSDKTGPDFNQAGGFQIGESSYWVGKYTIQPENGGVGVFAHEFGHDLGLPDLYDYYGENGCAFWTLMASGSWLDDGLDTIGNKSSHMGAWEKFQLGWLKYDVAQLGVKSLHTLGPMEFNTKEAQGIFVILPKKVAVANLGSAYSGTGYYYSGSDDDLDHSMFKPVNLKAKTHLTAKVRYNIELDWDYAYLVVSKDGGVTWTNVNTNLSTTTDPHRKNLGYGITGISKGWVDLSADLSAYAGDVMLGFRYVTDSNTGGFGLMIDEIKLTGYPTDGAEADAAWIYVPETGFHATNGVEAHKYNNYYVAEYRTYLGYDSTLEVGPYYFGYLDNPDLQDYVDHFPYQDGLLINYWDTSIQDNNTAHHPGRGLLLPVDAHYAALYRWDGALWRNRIQTYDSTFTLDPTDGIPNIHHLSVLSPVPSLDAVQTFDDRILHYDPDNPLGSVIHPNTGTLITIKKLSKSDYFMQVEVRPAE